MENLKVIIGGIQNPKITVKATLNENEDIILLADSKEIPLQDQRPINYDFVFNKKNWFYYESNAVLPKTAKKITIYLISGKTKKEIYSLNMCLFDRVRDRTIMQVKKIGHAFLRIPRVLKKIIVVGWTRYHFLVPPKMIKHYIGSIFKNINEKSIEEKFFFPEKQEDYLIWYKNQIEEKEVKLEYQPLISILVPVYNVRSDYLEKCIESVLKQTYSNFELCLVDDCSTKKETIETLKFYENKDSRLHITYRKKNGHIAEATNTALKMAKGEFIGLLDNDDILDSHALYEVAKALNENSKLEMIYTDEDKIHTNGKYYFPNFKPDYSPDTFLSSNYICHFTVLRKKIVEEIGGFRSEYNGSQDYDLFLRFAEKTHPERIHHIPKILYHWRELEGSTAKSSSGKNYAYLAGTKALEDALKRRGIKAIVHQREDLHMFSLEYLYEKEPLISIIIPTKDSVKLLRQCITSIYEKTNYKNFEVIVIDNNSSKQETFDFFEKCKKQYKNFRVYRYECEFNFSYLNNEAVKHSKGEYLAFLNNDTKVITKDWLKLMVGYAMQKHVGCVGAKLLYPDTTIQHCGVVLGVGGVASHAYVRFNQKTVGYHGRLQVPYNWGMATAACLMIKKSKFEEVQGFDENLKVAYNDVDLNVKIQSQGYYNVVLPNVELFHYESVSRGYDLAPEKRERFISEIQYIVKKHGDKLKNDTCYNPNFSHDYCFALGRKEDKHE